MSSPKKNSGPTQDLQATQYQLDAEAMNTQHQLVTTLRSILADPAQHTVGALAVAVERGLAELSLLKDRLDLIALDTSSGDGATPMAPASQATPGSGQSGDAGAAGGKGE
jgi:hypothetical protein